MRAELIGKFRLMPKMVGGAGWHIAPQVAGHPFVIPLEGLDVEVQFPEWSGSMFPITGYNGTSGVEGEGEGVVGISPIFVFARTEFTVPDDWESIEERDLRAIVQRTYDVTARALVRLRSWIRIGQPWIGINSLRPDPLEPVTVRTTTHHVALPSPWVGNGGVSVVGGPAFSRADLDEMIANGGDPPTSQEFLAEARLAIRWAPVKDPQRAVLLAAMACEQHAKEVLLRVSSDTTAALLSAVIRNVRALDLFSTIPEAIVNRSLKHEDPALLAQIRTMFELRNGLAHRGNRATSEQARDVVITGDAAFAWLQTLDAPTP